ncbi:MAG: hypothetical protein LBQ66_00440 [Planctomycetaceae bacterium]|jgi:hypothetical protein|nr:hypothetical protein [Planctomycetaceae bacterium]
MSTIIALFTNMPSLITNMWAIGKNIPTIIAIVKSICDLIGSDAVQSVFQSIKETIEKIKIAQPDVIEVTPEKTAEEKLTERIKERLSLAWLDVSDADYLALRHTKRIPAATAHDHDELDDVPISEQYMA